MAGLQNLLKLGMGLKNTDIGKKAIETVNMAKENIMPTEAPQPAQPTAQQLPAPAIQEKLTPGQSSPSSLADKLLNKTIPKANAAGVDSEEDKMTPDEIWEMVNKKKEEESKKPQPKPKSSFSEEIYNKKNSSKEVSPEVFSEFTSFLNKKFGKSLEKFGAPLKGIASQEFSKEDAEAEIRRLSPTTKKEAEVLAQSFPDARVVNLGGGLYTVTGPELTKRQRWLESITDGGVSSYKEELREKTKTQIGEYEEQLTSRFKEGSGIRKTTSEQLVDQVKGGAIGVGRAVEGLLGVAGSTGGAVVEEVGSGFLGTREFVGETYDDVVTKGAAEFALEKAVGGAEVLRDFALGAGAESFDVLGNVVQFSADTIALGIDAGVDTIASISPVGHMHEFAKQSVITKIEAKEARGEYVSPAEYQAVNSRPGDFLRAIGITVNTLAGQVKKHADVGAEHLGADTDGFAYGSGGFVFDMAAASVLWKKFNVGRLNRLFTNVEKIKNSKLVGTGMMEYTLDATGKLTKPGFLKTFVKSQLDKASKAVTTGDIKRVLNKSLMSTAVYDAVAEGKTNAASLFLGVMSDLFTSARPARKIRSGVTEKSLKSFDPNLSQEMGMGSKNLKYLMDGVETGLEQGWNGKSPAEFEVFMEKVYKDANEKANKILDNNSFTITKDTITNKMKAEVENMAKTYQKTDADAVWEYYRKNFLDNNMVTSGDVIESSTLKKVKENTNVLLSDIKAGAGATIKDRAETQYALTLKRIIDEEFSKRLPEAWKASNKAANSARILQELSGVKKLKNFLYAGQPKYKSNIKMGAKETRKLQMADFLEGPYKRMTSRAITRALNPFSSDYQYVDKPESNPNKPSPEYLLKKYKIGQN